MSNTANAASELRRPPESVGRQGHERRTPRLNPPTATGRCMSSDLPPIEYTFHELSSRSVTEDRGLRASGRADKRMLAARELWASAVAYSRASPRGVDVGSLRRRRGASSYFCTICAVLDPFDRAAGV